jgi:hypothetical protein
MGNIKRDDQFKNFFCMPKATRMASFCTLTPYYNETVCESLLSLLSPAEGNDGLTLLGALRLITPSEWSNFKQRVSRESENMRYHFTCSEVDALVNELTAIGTGEADQTYIGNFLETRLGITGEEQKKWTSLSEKRIYH